MKILSVGAGFLPAGGQTGRHDKASSPFSKFFESA